MADALIIDAVRTPRGRGKAGKGALSGIHPQELMGQTLNEVARRVAFDPREVDDVVLGTVTQAQEQGACLARNAVLAARWPQEVTGVSLNRFCGSGLQAVNFGAMGLMSGAQHLTVCGGVESMSRVPMGADQAGLDGNNERLRKRLVQIPQGVSADLIATLGGFNRGALDRFALESQQFAAAARSEGWLARSLFPVRDPETGKIVLEKDEHPRGDTTLDALGKLKPAFKALGESPVGPDGETCDAIALAQYPDAKSINHVHTAGNSSGVVDGAAALLMASDDAVKAHGLTPRARIVSMATAGTEPVIMLTAPTPASKKALRAANMRVPDIDLWEINEAFAVVPLHTMRELEIERDIVNVAGGAIAYGHPLGATGAMLVGTVLDELERRDLQTALITMCIGGGMGIATIIERV